MVSSPKVPWKYKGVIMKEEMKVILCRFSLSLFLVLSINFSFAQPRVKPRVIATTDGEIDDQSSMVRFLMYASDYDIAGIVQVNGVQKDGHSKDHWVEK